MKQKLQILIQMSRVNCNSIFSNTKEKILKNDKTSAGTTKCAKNDFFLSVTTTVQFLLEPKMSNSGILALLWTDQDEHGNPTWNLIHTHSQPLKMKKTFPLTQQMRQHSGGHQRHTCRKIKLKSLMTKRKVLQLNVIYT